jgi:glycosyltransferase involved in cell wall biosynthesis
MFGSNSEFYYELIPHIKDDIRLYDLTHAFVHNYESGQEKWSLPFVNRLTKRVVINRKTKNDYLEFYSKHNLSTELIDKIEVINNFVDVESDYKTKSASVFRIAYVGRGGEEKRIELIALLAKRIREEKTGKVEFHFVGDVQSIIPEDLKKFCVFHGVVNSDEEIKKLYEQFHVLVIASTREGFPMVIMEGMAHGVVPVCTNVGGIKEHVINDENGYLINSINEEDIINEFMEKFNYLINNHIEYNRLSLSAYKYAITHFHKELFNKSYNSLFGS